MIAAAMVVGFVALALVVATSGSFPGDEAILKELHELLGTGTDDLMVAIGDASDTLPVVATWLVVAGLLVRAGQHRDAGFFVAFVFATMVCNRILKELVRRDRPAIRVSPEDFSTYSFPSGHASNSIAVVIALIIVLPSGRTRNVLAAIGGVVVIVVAFSRLAVQVHYPSDVIASWLWVGAAGLVASTVRDRRRLRS